MKVSLERLSIIYTRDGTGACAGCKLLKEREEGTKARCTTNLHAVLPFCRGGRDGSTPPTPKWQDGRNRSGFETIVLDVGKAVSKSMREAAACG